jgi:hypothetical protein
MELSNDRRTESPGRNQVIRSRDCDLNSALRYDPFQGDETYFTLMSDKIVTARKDHPRCQICEAPILKGERHRARTEWNNENKTIMTFRFCWKCTRAMAHPDMWNEGRLIGSRYSIGYARRKNKTK